MKHLSFPAEPISVQDASLQHMMNMCLSSGVEIMKTQGHTELGDQVTIKTTENLASGPFGPERIAERYLIVQLVRGMKITV